MTNEQMRERRVRNLEAGVKAFEKWFYQVFCTGRGLRLDNGQSVDHTLLNCAHDLFTRMKDVPGPCPTCGGCGEDGWFEFYGPCKKCGGTGNAPVTDETEARND